MSHLLPSLAVAEDLVFHGCRFTITEDDTCNFQYIFPLASHFIISRLQCFFLSFFSFFFFLFSFFLFPQVFMAVGTYVMFVLFMISSNLVGSYQCFFF